MASSSYSPSVRKMISYDTPIIATHKSNYPCSLVYKDTDSPLDSSIDFFRFTLVTQLRNFASSDIVYIAVVVPITLLLV